MKDMKNVNIEVIKKLLFDNVFDGYCDNELNNIWGDFDSKFNSIVGIKEDENGYYVCVDKNDNILFNEVSISYSDNENCINRDGELYLNVNK